MSGIIGQIRSKSGVIGIDNNDVYKHSWKNYGGGYGSSSSETFDFSNVTIGSGITYDESTLRVTVSVAGTYLVSSSMQRGNSTTGISFDVYVSGSKENGTKMFAMAFSAHEFIGSSGTWVIKLAAGATIYVFGTGYTDGTNCFFSGIRIGA